MSHESSATTRRLRDTSALTPNIGFRDPQGAQRHLASAVEYLPSLAAVLPRLIKEAPDTDAALMLFSRLVGQSESLRSAIAHEPVLAYYAILVFGHSRYLGEMLLRGPGLLRELLAGSRLHRSFSRQDYSNRLEDFPSSFPECDESLLLARFKKREYLRILLRDVLRIAPLAETTQDIAALSDVLVEAALREAERALKQRYGAPSGDGQGRAPAAFSVLALGKLGGNELNYASDIDLLYLHGNGEGVWQGKISHHEYFVRLAQQMTEILSRVTEEGPVFRIDLRLRPGGRDGEIAVSLRQALRYYRQTAEDWERQALIKARHVAGDEALAREFVRGVEAEVYTSAINFKAIKTALVARERMVRHRARPLGRSETRSIDVKLDPGGIRDIEFLVQCLQRVYGGSEPWLRSRGTFFALQKLHDKGHLSSGDYQELALAYEFLRQVEHRLQLRHGQQTHRLPAAAIDLEILRRALKLTSPHGESFEDLERIIRERMAAVSGIYKRIILHQQTRAEESGTPKEFTLRSTFVGGPGAATKLILERLAADSPALYDLAAREDLAPPVKRNLLTFLDSAFASSERYAVLRQHPSSVERALEVFRLSSYLTDVLIRHPEEVITLGEFQGAPPGRGSGCLFGGPVEPEGQSSDAVFEHLGFSHGSEGERLALLRRHYRHRTFAEGAIDLEGGRGIYNAVGAMTLIAEGAIKAAFGIVSAPPGLAVLALGSLGTQEFDLCSDADLLFVRDEHQDPELATRAAGRVIQALAAYTQEGSVFPVDTRLRPHGSEGELVLTPLQLEAYFAQEAQPWEALTYTKIRFVAGDCRLGEQAIDRTRRLFDRFCTDEGFRDSLRIMRQKLEGPDPVAHFRTSPGGLYDLDFLTGYLLIQHKASRRGGNLRNRLWRCVEGGTLERGAVATLDHAAGLLRSADHATRLVTGKAQPWLPVAEHPRQMAAEVVGNMLGQDFGDALGDRLEEARNQVRSIYNRVFNSDDLDGPGDPKAYGSP